MRKDMAKVIVERPRYHGPGSKLYHCYRAKDRDENWEEGSLIQKMSHHYRWSSKELNENLAPLERFLKKQVGRPWNKVFSEISAAIKLTSTVQRHILSHIEDFIAVKTRMRGDSVMVCPTGISPCYLDTDHRDLYVCVCVCPKTGLIKRNPWRQKRKAS